METKQDTSGIIVDGKPVSTTRNFMDRLVQKPQYGLLVVAALFGVSILIALVTNNNRGAVAISPVVASAQITASGFTPATLKVERGQQVTWQNDDTAVHHLTADGVTLPHFDINLEHSASYTYTFEKSGVYHYYDPANTDTFTGTFIVE
jgi:plastocyanin